MSGSSFVDKVVHLTYQNGVTNSVVQLRSMLPLRVPSSQEPHLKMLSPQGQRHIGVLYRDTEIVKVNAGQAPAKQIAGTLQM